MQVLPGRCSEAHKASRWMTIDWNVWRKDKLNVKSLPVVRWANTTCFCGWKNPAWVTLMQFLLWTCRGAMTEFTTQIRFQFNLAATSTFSSSLNGISLHSIRRFIGRVNLNSMPSVSCSQFKTVKLCFFMTVRCHVPRRVDINASPLVCDMVRWQHECVLYSSKLYIWAFPTFLLCGSGWQKVPFSAITWVSTHQLAIQLSLDVMNSGESQWRSYWSGY